MATPFPFGSGNVLTAAQMNAITTLPVSTKTASYVLTVADLGTRIVMNSASPTTITVNTSIFGASDVVEILNIGVGVCTITAGTCTVGTSGTLALVQNAGGTLTFVSASASVFTASSVTAAPSGLVRVGGGTLSGASTTFSSVFSATYNSYLVLVTGAYGTANNVNLKLGSTTTGYYWSRILVLTNATTSLSGLANTTNIDDVATVGVTAATSNAMQFYIHNPYNPEQTSVSYQIWGDGNYYGTGGAQVRNTTSYTAFTLTGGSGSFSAGTVNIYGYSLS